MIVRNFSVFIFNIYPVCYENDLVCDIAQREVISCDAGDPVPMETFPCIQILWVDQTYFRPAYLILVMESTSFLVLTWSCFAWIKM